VTACSEWCPFRACLGCPYQGGETVEVTVDNGVVAQTCGTMVMPSGMRAGPAGNRALTTTTVEES